MTDMPDGTLYGTITGSVSAFIGDTESDTNDLLARFIAAAEVTGIDNPQGWAEQHRGDLVSAKVGDTTCSDVHAYAVATYKPTPRPGANPAAVTDNQIMAAVKAVQEKRAAG